MPPLLQDPSELADLKTPAVPVGPPIADPGEIASVRRPVSGEQEPLVTVPTVPGRMVYFDAYSALGVLPRRPPRLRSGVAERLRRAAIDLPDPRLGIAILDTVRTVDEQQALLEFYARRGPTAGYVASVNPLGPRPPHTTGGAVDLTLTWNAIPLALGSDFDEFSSGAHLLAFEDADSLVRRLRRVLAAVLSANGFVGYRLEWWHWSFGEDFWSESTGRTPIYDIA